jgi:hypothetical protein
MGMLYNSAFKPTSSDKDGHGRVQILYHIPIVMVVSSNGHTLLRPESQLFSRHRITDSIE